MQIHVEHRVDFVAAPTGQGYLAVARVLDETGKVLQSSDDVPIAAGQCLTFGLVCLDVPYPGTITTEPIPGASVTSPPGSASKPVVTAPQRPPVR